MKNITKTLIATPVALGLMAGVAFGVQQNWTLGQVGATFQDGSIIPTGGLTFAVGGFANGFEPTAGNFDMWVDNWVEEGLAGNAVSWSNLGNESFPSFGRLGDTGTHGTVIRPGSPLLGAQGYIFGFTSLDLSVAPEWILLTNDGWTFPTTGTAPGNPALPVDDVFNATTAGTQNILGSSTLTAAAALERGFQTQVVPEPSTYALIFGLGILGFLGYRRFRK